MKVTVRITIEDFEDRSLLVNISHHGRVEALIDYLKLIDEASHKAQMELSSKID